MRTTIVLTDGRRLQANFYHLRRDLAEKHGYDFTFELEGNIIEAFDRGQIKNYNKRVNGETPKFNSIYDGNAVTVCELTAPEVDTNGEHVLIGMGFAFCSELDQFSKSRGRQISLARAVRDLVKQGIEVAQVEN